MARGNELVYALNSGGVDKEALSRIDLERMRISGEHPVANWLPKVVGPMTVRPGFEQLAAIPDDDQTWQLPFAKSVATKFALLLSASEMRISEDGTILQVPDVDTVISTSSWTDESTGSASATGGATLTLNATATESAKLRQAVTVAAGDQAEVNILRIAVSRGPLMLRIGTTAGGQELVAETILETGTHKLGFTPNAATVYVELRSDDAVARTVSEIDFEANIITAPADLVLPTPWTYAQAKALRYWQSIDVIYAGDGDQKQRQIEFRGDLTGAAQSWSVVEHQASNGPYTVPAGNLSMTPGALTGNTTITASEAYFLASHVGALIELTQTGKTVNQTLNGADQATDYVTVTGVDAERIFFRTGVGSSFVGTLTLQRSVEPDNPTVWSDYATYVNGAATFAKVAEDDSQDNLTAHYRFSVKSGDYTSGSVEVTLEYENTTAVGQGLITGYTSATVVDVEVKANFGAITSTRSWRIGAWSDIAGWPRVPVIHDDRLHWFNDGGRDYASEVDDFVDHDDSLEGNNRPFVRSVAGGSLEGVVWALSDDRLIVGTPGFEATIQANDFDGALTATDYTSRKPSRRGCADIDAVSHHAGIFYAQRSAKRIYEISIPPSDTRYRSQNISRINPSACKAGIVRLGVQLQPETRLYAVLEDGSLVVLTYERDDDVVAFTTMGVPGGLIEDLIVLPDIDQDQVLIVVNRSGSRYHMRLGTEIAQESASTCTLLDYFKVLTGSISAISGATHLASTTVQVWADGARRADVLLDASGNGTLDGTYSRVVYGLNYQCDFESVKLAYVAQLGTAINQEKIIQHLGLVFSNSCLDGVRIGFDENNLDPLPMIIKGQERTASQFFAHLDAPPFPVPSNFDTDSRFYLRTNSADGPVTIQSVSMDIETPENLSPPRDRG